MTKILHPDGEVFNLFGEVFHIHTLTDQNDELFRLKIDFSGSKPLIVRDEKEGENKQIKNLDSLDNIEKFFIDALRSSVNAIDDQKHLKKYLTGTARGHMLYQTYNKGELIYNTSSQYISLANWLLDTKSFVDRVVSDNFITNQYSGIVNKALHMSQQSVKVVSFYKDEAPYDLKEIDLALSPKYEKLFPHGARQLA